MSTDDDTRPQLVPVPGRGNELVIPELVEERAEPLVPEVVEDGYVRDRRQGGAYVHQDDYRPPARFQGPRIPAWLRDPEIRSETLRDQAPQILAWSIYTPTIGLVLAYFRLWPTALTGLRRFLGWWWGFVTDNTRHHRVTETMRATGNGDPNIEEARHERALQLKMGVHLAALLALVVWLWLGVATPQARLDVVAGGILAAIGVFGLAGRSADSRPLVDWLKVYQGEAPVPDAGLVVASLHGIGVGTKANQTGVEVIQPPMRMATGWDAVVDLPRGEPAVSVEDVLPKRATIAATLRRPAPCVWLRAGAHEGQLVVTILRQALRDAPMPPWPFLEGGRWDWFEDEVPMGLNERGELAGFKAAFRNAKVGGIMDSGKTGSGMMTEALTQAHDPRVEITIMDLKGGGDWLPMSHFAHHFRSGNDPADHDANLAYLQGLEARMDARYRMLRDEYGVRRITPELAADIELDLWPVTFWMDETEEAFASKPYGERYRASVSRLVKLGRAVGITGRFATQEVSPATLPMHKVTALGHCFMVQSWREVDTVLGTGAHAAGFTANQLTPDDQGISYSGSGRDVEMVRWFYVDPDNGDLERVCRRLREERLVAGRLTGMASGAVEPDDRTDGIYDHLLAVWPAGADKLAYEDIVPLLAVTWPGLYGHWQALTPDAASRTVSRALGSIPSVTVAKGERRPRGVRHSDIVRAAA